MTIPGPAAAHRLGIATVFQDLALCENLNVIENLFLGQELGPFRLDDVAMEVRSWELLRQSVREAPDRATPGRRAVRWSTADGRDRPLAAR